MIIFLFFLNVLKLLKLGDNYVKILCLPESIESLELGLKYNEILELPNSLETLKLGINYNQPLILPTNLKNIILPASSNKILISSLEEQIKNKFNKRKIEKINNQIHIKL